jgi:hypothetical protein
MFRDVKVNCLREFDFIASEALVYQDNSDKEK